MNKIYVDVTQFHTQDGLGIFVEGYQPVLAGTSVSAMDLEDYNDEYKRFADEFDIHFIFEDNIPQIDFYTVPMVEIFAKDSHGGYIGSLGESVNLYKDIPICYIDKNKQTYIIAKTGKEFLDDVSHWKDNFVLYEDIEIFDSLQAAKSQYNFLNIK